MLPLLFGALTPLADLAEGLAGSLVEDLAGDLTPVFPTGLAPLLSLLPPLLLPPVAE
eukprot:CAMPEP_0173314924 /NCGR_PEP_ID=MMETSP1143-20121109/25611_1 /TAXON_ID=483371 /ORGANISM="non described non described, Strain CCMP2298" /LENGTH=56 /DNA_ID=CAMNT_0014257591 /DNA_START=325 /DNA_END=492 /DNA_ORIENTATION=-